MLVYHTITYRDAHIRGDWYREVIYGLIGCGLRIDKRSREWLSSWMLSVFESFRVVVVVVVVVEGVLVVVVD